MCLLPFNGGIIKCMSGARLKVLREKIFTKSHLLKTSTSFHSEEKRIENSYKWQRYISRMCSISSTFCIYRFETWISKSCMWRSRWTPNNSFRNGQNRSIPFLMLFLVRLQLQSMTFSWDSTSTKGMECVRWTAFGSNDSKNKNSPEQAMWIKD